MGDKEVGGGGGGGGFWHYMVYDSPHGSRESEGPRLTGMDILEGSLQ